MATFLQWLWDGIRPTIRYRQHLRVHVVMALAMIVLGAAPLAGVCVYCFLHHQYFYEHWFTLFMILWGSLSYVIVVIVVALFVVLGKWFEEEGVDLW